MMKNIMIAMLLLTTVLLTAQQGDTGNQPALNNELDSLSYFFPLRQTRI